MGIRLDWQIEADRSRNIEQGEDQEYRRAQRRWIWRLFAGVALLLGMVCLVIFLIHQRLEQIAQRSEQLLRDTVQAEIAALRIGDLDAFMALQQSAAQDWYTVQQGQFQAVAARKAAQDVNLTGRILSVEIDRQRARVQVEEIVDQTPYVETWFYWHYENGWRHVPPDYTFWGEERAIASEAYLLRYRTVDEFFAQQLSSALERWLAEGCAVYSCVSVPQISVDIFPMPGAPSRWNDDENWQLIVASPYTGRARADQPLTTQIQIELASLLAERLTDHHISTGLQPYEDAAYLRQGLITWLVGRFVQINTRSYLMKSLVEHYGADRLGQLVSLIQPGSGLSALAIVTGDSRLDQTPLDWRDFFAWRLELEMMLIASAQQDAFLRLYDQNDPSALSQAVSRYNANMPPEEVWVTLVVPQPTANGIPAVRATIQQGKDGVYREDYVLFRFLNGTWLRAS